jgi:hypothetical protein
MTRRDANWLISKAAATAGGMSTPKFDAIIVGSEASGGWVCMAMALAQRGSKIALVEAGSAVESFRDFKHVWPYELDFRGAAQPALLRNTFAIQQSTTIAS